MAGLLLLLLLPVLDFVSSAGRAPQPGAGGRHVGNCWVFELKPLYLV